jgi:hypothetical protein
MHQDLRVGPGVAHRDAIIGSFNKAFDVSVRWKLFALSDPMVREGLTSNDCVRELVRKIRKLLQVFSWPRDLQGKAAIVLDDLRCPVNGSLS